jgi:diguanylate cyclase (GGDEF)-like protein/PAS domain S-box-containing protein
MENGSSYRSAAVIALIYFVVGVFWIFYSDQLLLSMVSSGLEDALSLKLQTLKGWFYVLVTALLLYLLSRWTLKRQAEALHKLYRAEADLAISRAQLDHLLAASPTVLYALKPAQDKPPTPIWVSDSIERLLGYKAADVMADTWWIEHLDPRDREASIRDARLLLECGRSDREYRFRAVSGEVLWIHDTARVLYDQEGKPTEIIGSWTDITERHEREAKERLYATAFNHIDEGILVADTSEIIHSVNPAACRQFGYTEAELIGSPLSILSSGRHDAGFFRDLKLPLKQQGSWHGEVWNRCRNGEIKPQWLSVSVTKDDSGAIENYVAVYTDISELKASEQKLQHVAYHDLLTGLPNRTQLLAQLGVSLLHNQKNNQNQSNFALFHIDIDDFKSVNNSLGHSAGDELLKAITRRLQDTLAGSEVLVRLGGDEFALLSARPMNAEEARQIAARILDTLRAPFTLNSGRQIYTEACIGISLSPEHGENEETLMRNADTALYKAKSRGRNQFCFYAPYMNEDVVSRLNMETGLRQAMALEELALYYQPKLDTHTGELRGAEALIRWPHSDGCMTPPGIFIALAEQTGLIIALGDWIITESCRQIRGWLDMGLEPVSVAINISLRQFQGREVNLEKTVRDALVHYRIPPPMLNLEITESAIMEKPEKITSTLQSLKSLGVMLSLDDFGTGFSNMMQLSRLPIDYLKIDTSFTREIENSEAGLRVVRSVIELAHGLGLKAIAEGVETRSQLDSLRQLRCDEIQGFYMAAPMSAAHYTEWLLNYPSS